MLKQNKILIYVFLLICIFPFLVEARSGCCSHHGGVCGCHCCDGSPLSAKCILYYPKCNNTGSNINTKTPVSNSIVHVQKNTASVYNQTTNDDQSNKNYDWLTLMLVIMAGFGIYSYVKNNKS